MMISASTSSLSKVEFSPSLSEVVTRVWPWSSSHFRMPSSFWVVPSRPGTWKGGEFHVSRHRVVCVLTTDLDKPGSIDFWADGVFPQTPPAPQSCYCW